jgi:hypothetical protein
MEISELTEDALLVEMLVELEVGLLLVGEGIPSPRRALLHMLQHRLPLSSLPDGVGQPSCFFWEVDS